MKWLHLNKRYVAYYIHKLLSYLYCIYITFISVLFIITLVDFRFDTNFVLCIITIHLIHLYKLQLQNTQYYIQMKTTMLYYNTFLSFYLKNIFMPTFSFYYNFLNIVYCKHCFYQSIYIRFHKYTEFIFLQNIYSDGQFILQLNMYILTSI